MYKFQVSVADEPAEISNGVSGTYSSEKMMWIDKGTGSIIDQTEEQVRKLDNGTPVLDLELSFTDETVAANVEDAKANNSQLSLVGAGAHRARGPRAARAAGGVVPRLRRALVTTTPRRPARPTASLARRANG